MSNFNKSALTDNATTENHIIDWKGAKIIDNRFVVKLCDNMTLRITRRTLPKLVCNVVLAAHKRFVDWLYIRLHIDCVGCTVFFITFFVNFHPRLRLSKTGEMQMFKHFIPMPLQQRPQKSNRAFRPADNLSIQY